MCVKYGCAYSPSPVLPVGMGKIWLDSFTSGLVIMPHSSCFFSGGDFRGQSVVLTVTELMYDSLGNVFLRYLLPSLWIRPWSDRARAWSGGGIKLMRAAAARSGLGLGLGLGFVGVQVRRPDRATRRGR